MTPELAAPQASDLRDAAESDDRERITDLLEGMMIGADGAGIAELARLRERVGRMLEAVGRLADSPGSAYALAQLQLVDRFLDQSRTRAVGRRAQKQFAAAALTVRERVYELLAREAQRPRDIARELDVDASQVSRALRALAGEDMVERRETVTNDGRAHVYAVRAHRAAQAA